jgi:hypothetical protein
MQPPRRRRVMDNFNIFRELLRFAHSMPSKHSATAQEMSGSLYL